MTRQELQKALQAGGMSRFEARRHIYGSTWKLSTAPGRGVQRAITKAEKARREALRGHQEDGNDEGSGQEASDLQEGRVAPLDQHAHGAEDSGE